VRERAPDPNAERRRREFCDLNLDRLAEELGDSYDEVSKQQVVGSARKTIPRVARRENAGLVVVGKSDKAGGLSAVMGSVAEEISKSAPCSVFIVSRADVAAGAEGGAT
jgi:nucleotide-binding universal stress UspA family protein